MSVHTLENTGFSSKANPVAMANATKAMIPKTLNSSLNIHTWSVLSKLEFVGIACSKKEIIEPMDVRLIILPTCVVSGV